MPRASPRPELRRRPASDDRELYETFATPFEAAANEADVSGTDGQLRRDRRHVRGRQQEDRPHPAAADAMKYRGTPTSDGAAIMTLYNYFHIAPTYKEAGRLAKKGGLDTDIPDRQRLPPAARLCPGRQAG